MCSKVLTSPSRLRPSLFQHPWLYPPFGLNGRKGLRFCPLTGALPVPPLLRLQWPPRLRSRILKHITRYFDGLCQCRSHPLLVRLRPSSSTQISFQGKVCPLRLRCLRTSYTTFRLSFVRGSPLPFWLVPLCPPPSVLVHEVEGTQGDLARDVPPNIKAGEPQDSFLTYLIEYILWVLTTVR